MSRSAGGSYSLPASGNPVVTNTTISSAWGNTTLADIATEITNSLDRQGRGGMLAPIRTTDGSKSAPAHSFTSEAGSGLYRAGAGDVRLSVGGVDAAKFEDDAVTLPLNTTVEGTLTAGGGLTVVGALIVSSGSASFNASTTITRPTPTTLSANTGWTLSTARYWKDAVGMVHLEATGTFAAGGASNPFNAALPAGYRPAQTVPLMAVRSTTGGTIANGIVFPISVDTSGVVANTSMTDADAFYLNASFYAAN